MKTPDASASAAGPSELLLAEEVGRRLRLPLSTVYHLAKKGELPAIRFGRSWRFPAAGIERLLGGIMPVPRVLVVDDDAVARGLVDSALTPEGCQVREAESAEQALEFCRRQRFDVLFVDLQLPGRSGAELIQELLGEYTLDQMIVITAHPDLQQAASLLELGPLTLLRKPLDVSRLKACVRRLALAGSPGGLA